LQIGSLTDRQSFFNAGISVRVSRLEQVWRDTT